MALRSGGRLLWRRQFCSVAHILLASICNMASTTSAATEQSYPGVVRLGDVSGDGDKVNEVIVGGDVAAATSHVIYFGGDIQDYVEKMKSHRDNGRYAKWNLEKTCQLLMKRFPTAAIFIVKPHHMHLHTFSVYSNFVASTDFGVPEHSPDFGAWRHLQKLLESAVELALLRQQGSNTTVGADEVRCSSVREEKLECTPHKSVQLLGFSKGCVVLNQLVMELKEAMQDEELQAFMSRVSDFYWLDGGHSGGRDIWITKESDLVEFAKLKAVIWVCVTPYQVRDPMRKWIGREEREFVEKLRRLKARVTETVFFTEEPRSIEKHFEVLTSF